MLDIKCFSSYYSDGKASSLSSYSAMMSVMLALLLLSFQPATAAPEDDGTGIFDYWKSGVDWPGVCAEGKGQSPINIVTKRAVQGTPSKLWFDYEETSNVTLYHTGHVVEVKVNNNNNVMHTPDGPFYLKQLHFHAVSEHTFNGMFGPLEVHYVHLNAEGTLASVFGVVFKLDKDDKDNRYLDDFFHRIPNNTDARINFYWNLKELIIPRKEKRSYLSYYTYTGSLTTPPCSEIVTWYVRKRAASVSIKQLLYVLKANQDVSGDRFDDRLPQPIAGRTVTYVPVI